MNLELAILQTLEAAATATDRPLTEQVILGGIAGFVDKLPTLHELQRALNRLQSKGYIKGQNDEFRGTLWLITTEGKLRL
jgi:hypothetical protein